MKNLILIFAVLLNTAAFAESYAEGELPNDPRSSTDPQATIIFDHRNELMTLEYAQIMESPWHCGKKVVVRGSAILIYHSFDLFTSCEPGDAPRIILELYTLNDGSYSSSGSNGDPSIVCEIGGSGNVFICVKAAKHTADVTSRKSCKAAKEGAFSGAMTRCYKAGFANCALLGEPVKENLKNGINTTGACKVTVTVKGSN